MPGKSIDERIAQLEARARTLKARKAQQDRAKDTRRKILLGALILNRLEHSADTEFSKRLTDWIRRELPGFLSREEDKTLFADLLNPKPDAQAPIPESEKADA